MPAATEENLPQVLSFEMDRLTPFRSDEVYFDHRVVGRDRAIAIGDQLRAHRSRRDRGHRRGELVDGAGHRR